MILDSGKPSLTREAGTPSPVEKPENVDLFVELYRHMLTARHEDALEEEYTARGETFFQVSGAGHEAVAALNPHLIDDDYLHCHYRDKALLLARGVSVEMFFLSLFCKDGSHSRGRQMSAHMCDASRNVLSMVGPVGNQALQAVGIAQTIRDRDTRPIVLCAMGDGSSQQGEVLEAIAEAVRWTLPVLFLVEDNHYAISTVTDRRTFYSRPDGEPDAFYGIPITRIDGCDVVQAHRVFGEAVARMREDRAPAIVHLQCERLGNHTNADDQRMYRSAQDIEQVRRTSDPIPHLHACLLEWGVDAAELDALDGQVRADVRDAGERALRSPEPEPVRTAVKPLPASEGPDGDEYRGAPGGRRLTMIEAIREVLRRHLHDQRVSLYGEDIEDPKGDVFGITRGLSDDFPGQVRNAPLTESTIVGVSVGRALAGERPVAFLQFADFLPLAFNQIISEMGSIHWRTNGAWQCPVIVMITCGGYRPGLGPFHAQTFESIAAHTPGVDVMMPSTAGDAAGLLNAAFASGRPTLFFYPKGCLNDRGLTTSEDVEAHRVPIGKARIVRAGQDLSLVGYGNAVSRCLKAAEALESVGVLAEVIDLRTIAPWDQGAVIASVRKTGRLLVVHEDNHTCGMGGEVIATATQRLDRPFRAARVTRPDTYVPCNFGNQLEILPSFRRVLETAAELLDLDLRWQKAQETEETGVAYVEAIGASPTDDAVTILEWRVKPGDTITRGDNLAEYEADKAAADLLAPIDGNLVEILVPEGQQVPVGTRLLRLKTTEDAMRRPVTEERPGTPVLKRRPRSEPARAAQGAGAPRRAVAMGLGAIAPRLGSREVPNRVLLRRFKGRSSEDIVRRTGIESRHYVAEGETVTSMAVDAARAAMKEQGLSIADLHMIVAHTGTPERITPTLACLVHHALAQDVEAADIQAHDVNAACTGYLYALQTAYDFIQVQPDAGVLLVTSEVLSPLLDADDFDTAIIFGDAATATVLLGEEHPAFGARRACVRRPLLSAVGEPGKLLSVPLLSSGEVIRMEGRQVFTVAVRKMTLMLERSCAGAECSVGDLDLVIPHQANQRIAEAIRGRLGLAHDAVYSNIRHLGNTSSSSIPLALAEVLADETRPLRIGLCAFGGGFTYGAALLETEGA